MIEMAFQNIVGKMYCSIRVLGQLASHLEKNEMGALSHSLLKMNSSWFKNLSIKIKLLKVWNKLGD